MLAIYVIAILNRSSLGVAGLIATDRFEVSASLLSMFGVFYLIVYAAFQIPNGVLIDRFGPRTVILSGAAVMTVGQGLFAISDNFALAVVARLVVGLGDAMTFPAALRLAIAWFPPSRVPARAQWVGIAGFSGGLLASFPLSFALRELGWVATFSAVAIVGAVILVLAALVLPPEPADPANGVVGLRTLAVQVAEVWTNPGTRLGWWTHFVTGYAPAVFTLLWGYPFLVVGQGRSESTAGLLLAVQIVASVLASLVLARLGERWHWHRSSVVLAMVAVMAGAWAVVLVWPGRAPLWLLVALVCALGVGGPTSMLAFDLVRPFHVEGRLGRANGVVNMGCHAATLLVLLLIGIMLDLVEPRGMTHYTLGDFRVALSVQFLFWGIGAIQIVRYRRRARALYAERQMWLAESGSTMSTDAVARAAE